MNKTADLVMPKLGSLTMTEGTLAQWAVAPGASFAAEDVVAVVETDKIAYEVRAPSAGTLSKILVPAGTTVAVGAPIAQWQLDGTTAPQRAAAVVAEAPAAPAPASASAHALSPTPPVAVPSQGNRIIATPYARRIARNAGIELATVTAANNRRIRAADVERAIARRAAGAQTATQPGALKVGFAMLGTEVSADRLVRMIDDLAEDMPELQPSPCHFVVLAAARALAEHGVAPVIGLQHGDSPPHMIHADACRSLSGIVAADRTAGAAVDAAMALLVADHGDATLVARMLASDGNATLGVGAISRVFRPDAAGAPVLRAELHLALVRREDSAPFGQGLLERVRTLLENPFLLLAM